MTVVLPRMILARQSFVRPAVVNRVETVMEEMAKLLPTGTIPPGARIGVTAGSRGITGIAEVTRAVIDFLKLRGASPFVIAAMGSHGGAESEGQRSLIANYGITEDSVGAPIRTAMATRSLGRTKNGVEVFFAEDAWMSDGIVLLNRIKPHTHFKGPIESGLSKICAIGLGKERGAEECHSHQVGLGLGVAIQSVTERILSTGKILGGLGILENAYHETARIEAVPARAFFESEAELLEEARGMLATLPVDEIDVLLCDQIGKNVSGTGMDTNVIGRSADGYQNGRPWQPWMPKISRIVVLDLTDESEGNAIGMGLADYVTEHFLSKVDARVSMVNAVAAFGPELVRAPIALKSDRDALTTAIRTSVRRPEGPRIIHVKDTLNLEFVRLSEACLPFVRAETNLEILAEAQRFHFDHHGRIISSFD